MTDSEAQHLARLYFSGDISPEDETSLYAYIRQDETSLALFRQWEEEWETVHDDATEQAWASFARTIQPESHSTSRLHLIYKYVATIAATVAVTVGVGLFAMKSVNKDKPERFYALSAPLGSTAHFEMADGTMVWLNAGSTLRYSDRFNDGSRRVELDGEAYFEVRHKDDEDFTVSTKGYDVVVKGTHFDVSAYPDDEMITTSLMQGHVIIENGRDTLDMKPGYKVSMDKRSGKFNTVVMTDDASAWKSDMADYTSITLAELAHKLSRQYDVQIDVRGERLRGTKVSISLNNELTIDEVIEALRTVTQAKVKRHGRQIIMT